MWRRYYSQWIVLWSAARVTRTVAVHICYPNHVMRCAFLVVGDHVLHHGAGPARDVPDPSQTRHELVMACPKLVTGSSRHRF